MSDVCALPWSKLGLNREQQLCCCSPDRPSLCLPGPFAAEITDSDFESDGVMGKIWNSSVFQGARSQMAQSIMAACNREYCGLIPPLGDIDPNTYTELQYNNFQQMLASFKNKETTVTHYPTQLEIWLDETCNMDCFHCGQKDFHMRQLPIANFQNELKDYLRYAISCVLLGGEPTVCKDYDLFMSLVKEVNAAKVNIITNGQFIIQKIIPYLDHISNIHLSIDAASSEIYRQMRPGKSSYYNFDRLIFNLDKLQKPRIRSKTSLGFSFIMNGINYKEMPNMIELAKKYYTSYVFMGEVCPCTYPADKRDTIMFVHDHPEQVNDYLDAAIKKAEELEVNLAYDFSRSLKRTKA